ncbi:hypothetical protein OTU49_006485, partial [Cherax quadricarinatus]
VVMPKPSNLRVLTTNSEYIDIDWQFDGDQRDVEYTVKVFYSSGELAKEQGSRVASARVGELAPSTDYTVSVMAFKALPRGRRANSPDSDPVSVRTQDVVIPKPSNLRVLTTNSEYIDIDWQYGEGGVEFLVNVYYSGEQFAKDQLARGTSARVGGLAPGTDYTLKVKAFKALPHGRRAYSAESEPVSATTQDVVIPKPSNLRVLTTNSEYIDIDWQFDGDQRDVEYTVKVFYSSGVLAKEQGSRVASARVGELAPSTDYTVSVMAFKALPRGRRANSPDSDPVSVRTQGTSPPVTPPTRPTTPPPPPTRPTTPPPPPTRPTTPPPPPTRPTTPPPPPTRPTTPPPPSTRPTTPPPPTPAGCGEGLCSCP